MHWKYWKRQTIKQIIKDKERKQVVKPNEWIQIALSQAQKLKNWIVKNPLSKIVASSQQNSRNLINEDNGGYRSDIRRYS